MPYTLEDSKAVGPGAPSTTEPDAAPPLEPDSGTWSPEEGSLPAKGMAALKLLSHTGSFGLDSKILGILGGEESEKRSLENVNAAREELGLAALPIEIYGAIKSPIAKGAGFLASKLMPGTVAAAGQAGSKVLDKLLPASVAPIAKGAAGAGLKGLAVGGLAGAASYAGEHPMSELNKEDALEAAKTGALWGGGLGTVGGGVLGYLGSKADRMKLSALASTKGDILRPGKQLGLGEVASQNKAQSIANAAYDKGITGGFLQPAEETLAKAKTATASAGKEGENIRDAIYQMAQSHHNPAIGPGKDLLDEVMTRTRQGMEKNMSLTKGHLDALKDVRAEVAAALNVTKKQNPTVLLTDLYDAYRGVKDRYGGMQGANVPSSGPLGRASIEVRKAMRDIFKEEARKISPELADALMKADKNYSNFKFARTMAAAGLAGEKGQRFGGGLIGRVGGLTTQLFGHTLPGKAIGYALGNKMAQRGILPNTGLSVLRNAKKLTTAQRLAGTVAGSQQGSNQTPDF
jgi:hypothetical protein